MIVSDPSAIIFPDVFVRLQGVLNHANVILKLEGLSVTGSIKIKTARYMMDDLEERGLARPGHTTIVESSSGNLGVALSLVCQRRGYQFVCVTDPNSSRTARAAMEAYGADVVVVEKRDANGGYLQSRIAHIQALIARDPSYVWLNQYANPANQRTHYATTAREILGEIPDPGYVVIGAGSTGTLMGCAEFFRKASPRTKIVAAEPVGSVSFGGRPSKRLIPGVGTSRRPELLDDAAVDRVLYVPESETIRMCHELSVGHGLLVGGSTGTVLSAVKMLEGTVPAGETVVAVSPDMGEKYLDTIYNKDWVLKNFGFDPWVDVRWRDSALSAVGKG